MKESTEKHRALNQHVQRLRIHNCIRFAEKMLNGYGFDRLRVHGWGDRIGTWHVKH